mmetsp:Transcript_118915/g.341643  ORF Transcript_118915/g.341643 Transcript_118915/m.341643 type:complete len:239 (-) Transcript_118915:734-1450(-)
MRPAGPSAKACRRRQPLSGQWRPARCPPSPRLARPASAAAASWLRRHHRPRARACLAPLCLPFRRFAPSPRQRSPCPRLYHSRRPPWPGACRRSLPLGGSWPCPVRHSSAKLRRCRCLRIWPRALRHPRHGQWPSPSRRPRPCRRSDRLLWAPPWPPFSSARQLMLQLASQAWRGRARQRLRLARGHLRPAPTRRPPAPLDMLRPPPLIARRALRLPWLPRTPLRFPPSPRPLHRRRR